MYERAEKLFYQAVGEFQKIFSITRIYEGYSNETYKVVGASGVYKVRIARNNDLIDRKNELKILKCLDYQYVYYDTLTGDSVWHWIEGENLKNKCIDEFFLKKIVLIVENIHSHVDDEILIHDDLEFFESTKEFFSNEELSIYLKIVEKYKDEPKVLCHNDISKSNLIFNEESQLLFLIDYEWGRMNNPYWDYGNLIKEANLNHNLVVFLCKEINFNIKKIYEFAVLSSIYSIQLSYLFKNQNSELFEYRNRLRKQLKDYLIWLKK